jgi:hypothetical protein
MGAIPIHPKSIGRMLENRMGDSERIAETTFWEFTNTIEE